MGETDLTDMHLRTGLIFRTRSVLAVLSASVVARSLEMDLSEFSVDGAEEVGGDAGRSGEAAELQQGARRRGEGERTGDVPVALCSLGPS